MRGGGRFDWRWVVGYEVACMRRGEVKERAKVEALRMLSGMAESAAMRDESPGGEDDIGGKGLFLSWSVLELMWEWCESCRGGSAWELPK